MVGRLIWSFASRFFPRSVAPWNVSNKSGPKQHVEKRRDFFLLCKIRTENFLGHCDVERYVGVNNWCWGLSGQVVVATSISTVPSALAFRSPTGPSTVLLFVLGNELLWGDWASLVRGGGVGATEVGGETL